MGGAAQANGCGWLPLHTALSAVA